MQEFLLNGLKNWRTTLQSVLTVTIAVSGYMALNPQPYLPAKVTAAVMAAGSIAKIIVGISQHDGQK